MPYIPNTPESHTAVLTPLTPTVCRGVSNDGKPCKKELTRNATSGQPQSGILAIVGKDQAYFCSRHQDQAQDVVLRHTASFARRRALVGRGSLDTLIEQVELLVGDSSGPTLSTTVVSTTRPVAAGNDPFYRPPVEDETQHPAPKPPSPPTGHQQQHNRPPRKRRGLLARLILGCCCGPEREDPDDEKNWSDRRREAELRSAAAAVVDENFPKTPMRARKNRPADAHVAFNSVPPTPPLPMMYPPQKPASAMARTSRATVAGHGLSPTTPATVDEDAISEESDDDDVPAIDMSKLTSDQRRLLQLIPATVNPAGLAKLQRELLKPFSPKDEPGYIYMFWLTDSPLSPAPTPVGTPGAHPSNATRLLHAAHGAASTPGGTRPKLLFKIGRAANVQRRLHQWITQCNYNLALIRYYPHSSGSTPGAVARRVPNVNRIERLIHLELSATPGANPHHKCDACGKTHKEWFEIEASREGVLGVDALIKRWIAFGERSAVAGSGVPSPAGKTTLLNVRPKPPRQNVAAADPAGGVKMYVKKAKAGSSSGSGGGKTSAASPPKAKRTSKKLAAKKKKGKRGSDDEYDDDGDEEDSWGEDNYRP